MNFGGYILQAHFHHLLVLKYSNNYLVMGYIAMKGSILRLLKFFIAHLNINTQAAWQVSKSAIIQCTFLTITKLYRVWYVESTTKVANHVSMWPTASSRYFCHVTCDREQHSVQEAFCLNLQPVCVPTAHKYFLSFSFQRDLLFGSQGHKLASQQPFTKLISLHRHNSQCRPWRLWYYCQGRHVASLLLASNLHGDKLTLWCAALKNWHASK